MTLACYWAHINVLVAHSMIYLWKIKKARFRTSLIFS